MPDSFGWKADKLEALEKKPVEEWRAVGENTLHGCGSVTLQKNRSGFRNYQKEEEIIQMMEEKENGFFKKTPIWRWPGCGPGWSERDEQVVYEKGIAQGRIEGLKMLVKLVLKQRIELTEQEEKQIRRNLTEKHLPTLFKA